MNDYNRRLIEEFRAHGGKAGGMWEGTPLLLLTTTGARSGERRTTPMGYLPDGDRLIVWASNGGSPTHPGWYHNLLACGYEVRILPVTLEAEQVVVLSRCEDDEAGPWLVPHQVGTHPNEAC